MKKNSDDKSTKLQTTATGELSNLLNVEQVKKVFRLGSEVFTYAQPFIDKPTWWNATKMCLGIGKIFVENFEVWTDAFFQGDEWIALCSDDFDAICHDVLDHYPVSTTTTSDKCKVIRVIDFEGVKAGWVYNTHFARVERIFVETKKLIEAKQIIKRLLWEKYKGQPIVMKKTVDVGQNSLNGFRLPTVTFEIDDAFKSMPSKKATDYSEYLKRCLDAGVSRSVMLYGPPGTGKSTMARTLVDNLELKSLRIRVEHLGSISNATLFEAITMFEPDAIILDDFDRAHDQASLLETLEFFQRHVKLVVATVNNKNNLDEAILRPGRFDELVLIDHMDEMVVKMMLGAYSDGYEDVKDWPIAFIQEYVKRRRFMSIDEAAATTKDLARRVKRLDKYKVEDDGGVKQMLDLLKKAKDYDEANLGSEDDDESCQAGPFVPFDKDLFEPKEHKRFSGEEISRAMNSDKQRKHKFSPFGRDPEDRKQIVTLTAEDAKIIFGSVNSKKRCRKKPSSANNALERLFRKHAKVTKF